MRPLLVTEPVEDAVHDLRLVFGEKGMGDVDIFGDDHARRDIAANQDLVGAGAKDGAQDGIDAGQAPALGELAVDQRVDAELLAHHAFDEIAEEARLRLAELAALDLLAQAMRLELGDDLGQIDPGHVHLIERLDCGKAGGTSRGGAGLGLAALSHGG